MDIYRDIDNRDLVSIFENSYHNPILVREQRGWDEEFVNEEFQPEEEVQNPFQCFVDWNSLPTYDIYVNDEDLIEISFWPCGQEQRRSHLRL
jgi:hypothetical protein